MKAPLVVNFGGGDNSTGLLVGLHERGIRPDLILFADTGDEKPNTYQHLWELPKWLQSVRFPPLIVIRRKIRRGKNKGKVFTLEEECYANKTLPSRAFGYSGCSVKWKAQVVDGALRRAYREHIKAGGSIRRMIGIDFGELTRAKWQPTPPFEWEYPLIDWRWGREECVAAIERAGMKPPGKSACYYCPSSKKAEVIELMEEHPDLYARAVAMERMAAPHLVRDVPVREDCPTCAGLSDLDYGLDCPECGGTGQIVIGTKRDTKIKGLGRHWSWEDVGDAHRRKLDMVVDESHCDMPCGAECGT